jgi:hypothetical protein
MKKSSKVIYGVAVAMMAGCFIALCARVQRPSSTTKFDYALRNSRLAVAMFYKSGKKEKQNREIRSKIEEIKDAFSTLANRGRYEDAEIVFIRVNADRSSLEQLAKEYGVEKYPSFILFDEDEVIADYYGVPVVLSGFVTRAELKTFIEDNLGSRIEKILKQKDALIKRRKEEARVSWVPYYYPYDYYYPYWDFYGRRPSYSPGIGFGYRGHVRYTPHRGERYRGKYRGHRGEGHHAAQRSKRHR